MALLRPAFLMPGTLPGISPRTSPGTSPITLRRREPLGEGGAAEIQRLRLQLRIQAAVIAAQQVEARFREERFERATQAARMGLWECDLRTEALRWSGGVYDLFGLPRDRPPDRRSTLNQYVPTSRSRLTSVRAQAITDGTGFTLDSEIVTPAGQHRWIRLTATVDRQDGVPVRLFGMKQDVTDDLLLLERTRRLAECDSLTDLANRAGFEARLRDPVAALLLIDLDGFKAVNDTHGHQAGDQCLRETARRLRLTCRKGDLLARLGGDEFAVVVERPVSPEAAALYAQGIIDALCRPVDGDGRRFPIGASVGIALSGPAPLDLYACADAALYAAKAAGRGTFRLFDAAADPPIRSAGITGARAAG